MTELFICLCIYFILMLMRLHLFVMSSDIYLKHINAPVINVTVVF